ncbi:MAG: T9SS type A sorting domain-containing protein [Candidatus Latescibacteria bacterium]|nr:T9SS type A sorting domain-containing protein [Candidatus Latescibacterota bacterium]
MKGLAFLLLLIPAAASAATHRVPSDYATIQAGIDACSEGDTVLVAPGTYTGAGNRDLNFHGVNLVLTSEAGAEATVIDCEHESRAITFGSGEGPSSLVSGFTLYQGSEWNGGAIHCEDASPTLRELVIDDCVAQGIGGGLYLRHSSASFTFSTVRNCQAGSPISWGGGGGGLGAYVSSPLIHDVRFERNTVWAGDVGGECCPEANGGGVFLQYCDVDLHHLVFYQNQAIFYTGGNGSGQGGGLYSRGDITLSDATFVGNGARRGSGSVIKVIDGTLALERVLIAYNGIGWFSPGLPVVGDVTASCCLSYGNTGGNWVGGLDGQEGINGNLTINPWLCGWKEGVLTVSEVSPCLPENNSCGALIGALGMGCSGPAPDGFVASADRSDGVFMTWGWTGSPPSGFQIERDHETVLVGVDPQQRSWLDSAAEVGEHDYALRAIIDGGASPLAYAEGKRLTPDIVVTSPNGGEVLHFGAQVNLRWLPDAGETGELVDVELSRSGPDGPWETLFAGTAHDGQETWIVAGEYSTNCYLRVKSPDREDISDAPFKVGTHETRVPEDAGTVAEALLATARHDTVTLAPGSYFEHGLSMVSGAVLRGDVDAPGSVLVNGQWLGRILDCSNTDEETLVEGLTFLNGHVVGSGGAMVAQSAKLTVQHCRFIGNTATGSGGAISMGNYGTHPRFRHCVFEGNSCGQSGGAISIPNVSASFFDCRFAMNSANDGGAVYAHLSDPDFQRCHFEENHAVYSGGAAYLSWVLIGVTPAPIQSCVFVRNHSGGDGGALHLTLADVELTHLTFVANDAQGSGSAIFTNSYSLLPIISKCLIWGSGQGAVIGCAEESPLLDCCDLFVEGEDAWAGCVAGQLGANGNVSLDPRFCNPDAGDFRLMPDSPCLPANNDCGVLIGAFGEGCDNTPVLLSSFTATPAAGAVDLTWQASLGEFRLTAAVGETTWDVPWTATGEGVYAARDVSPQLAPGGGFVYTLEGREPGETWQLLRALTVTVPPAFATRLFKPHPNPFNPKVTVPFSLAAPGRVRVEVFDLAGRRVATLADRRFGGGAHDLTWDGADQASGVYLLRFSAAGHTQSKRLVLLR